MKSLGLKDHLGPDCPQIRILDELYDGVFILNEDKKITYWNKSAERITGYAQSEILGQLQCTNLLLHIDEFGVSLCNNACPVNATFNDGTTREADVYIRHKEGYRIPVSVKIVPLYDENNQMFGIAEIFSNKYSKEPLIMELEKLNDIAMSDSLTGQKNRRHGEMLINSMLSLLKSSGELSFGLLFLDLDKFKNINDTYGHEVGDQVLIMVSSTIRNSIRARDTIIRWGGEEFIIILPDVSDTFVLEKIANKLRVLVEHSSLQVAENTIQVTISIGATLALRTDTEKSLVKRADKLLYESKKTGRNRVAIG